MVIMCVSCEEISIFTNKHIIVFISFVSYRIFQLLSLKNNQLRLSDDLVGVD